MDKTIRVGDIYTEEGYNGVFVWSRLNSIVFLYDEELNTKELIDSGQDASYVPNIINKSLSTRESIALHKSAVELGMNEHEDVTYWLRDYIVEKIREAQAIS